VDRIRELDSFVAAVEAGSFVKAADALDTSKAVISKHMLGLEQRLGVRLLNRTTRRQSLTDAGRSYFERAKQILESLEDADATVASSALRPTGTLRITAPLTFGLLYLAPLWGGFMSRYPEVKLDITLSDRVVDLIDEGLDVAVRIARLPDSSLVSRKLASARMVMCASPAYLRKRGAPKTLAEVARHPVLAYTYLSTGDTWKFERKNVAHQVTTNPIMRSNNGDTCRAAALAGRGIILQPSFMIAADLERGDLVEVLPEYKGVELGVYAVYPSRKLLSAKVRVLVDFLAEKITNMKRASVTRPKRVRT
jgi:DNA-binding transcriptional LysR family regulator